MHKPTDLNIKELAEHTARLTTELLKKESCLELEYLNTKQASLYLGLAIQTLEIWRSRGGGP